MSAGNLKLKNVKVGTELPPLDVEVTAAKIVAGAVATRDFTPVHHDKAVAQAAGMQDIIMNIVTTNGFVGRFVTDWAGPDCFLRNVSVKLGAPNFPGDTMKMTGKVTAVDAAEGVVDVEVTAANSWGDHATGSVRVALPKGD